MPDLFFTDFAGDHSARYFYARGVLWGFVFANMLWLVVLPWIKEKLVYRRIRRNNEERRCSRSSPKERE